MLNQDTQASGVPSPTPPAAAHTLVADASGTPDSTGKQPSTGIGLASSGRMPPPVIPTVLGAGRYVMGMKSVIDREPRAGGAPEVARCGGQPEGTWR